MIGLESEVYYQISGLLGYNVYYKYKFDIFFHFQDYILSALIVILLSTTAIIYPQQWQA